MLLSQSVIIKIVLAMFLFVTLICLFLYMENIDISKKYETERLRSIITKQNSSATIDSIKMVADSVLYYKVFVRDIKVDTEKYKKTLEKQYVLLENIVKLSGDETLMVKEIIYKDLIDTNIINVPFEGKIHKVTVDGNTTYNHINKSKSYRIHIKKEPSEIKTFLYYNEPDSSVSCLVDVDGDRAVSTTVIDDGLYKLLLGVKSPKNGLFDRLKIGVDISYSDKVDIGIVSSFNIGGFSIGYVKSYYNQRANIDYQMSINNIYDYIKR